MASDTRVMRKSRIVRDVRPILMGNLLIVPPSRRGNRILGRVPRRLALVMTTHLSQPQRRPVTRRGIRIVGGAD